MFRFMQPFKKFRCKRVQKGQLFTDIPAAWVALPSLPVGRDRGAAMALRVENMWQILQTL